MKFCTVYGSVSDKIKSVIFAKQIEAERQARKKAIIIACVCAGVALVAAGVAVGIYFLSKKEGFKEKVTEKVNTVKGKVCETANVVKEKVTETANVVSDKVNVVVTAVKGKIPFGKTEEEVCECECACEAEEAVEE